MRCFHHARIEQAFGLRPIKSSTIRHGGRDRGRATHKRRSYAIIAGVEVPERRQPIASARHPLPIEPEGGNP